MYHRKPRNVMIGTPIARQVQNNLTSSEPQKVLTIILRLTFNRKKNV